MKNYTHIVMESDTARVALLEGSHRPLTFVQGFSQLELHPLRLPPLSVRLSERLVLLEAVGFSREQD